jgi:oligopeptide transport system substrate-binding protein
LPEITYVYWVEYPREADIAEWIAGQYRDILGVEITLQPMEGQAMVEAMSDVATYPQLVFSGWVQDYPDPQNWLSVFWACNSTFAQEFGYCNERFDAVARQADQELDPERRLALYEEAGQILIDDVPGVFLSHGVFHYLVNPEITGIVTTPVDSTWPGQTASLLTMAKQ